MKRFALICLFATMAFGMANAQNTETKEVPENGAKIRFTELEHNYGTIQKGGNGDCEFTFVNEGNEPLILSNVKASCGCTTPSYTQKPVMPGQTGTIKVHYNTNNVGGFSKTVTVTSNAVNDGGRVVLKIKGNVKQDADAAQPNNVQPKVQTNTRKPEPGAAKPVLKPIREDAKAVPAQAKTEEKAKQ
ncbi:MAG: DUF1573 domain-containing protein [Bacteroidales bacterium]|nr:DUF1573 domain-containing protein [Bacteroidales bacterium]